MVLNYIWIAFFLLAAVCALIQVIFYGNTTVLTDIINSTFDSSKSAFEISLGLTGVLSLWMGIMKIGEMGGVVNALARILSPVFNKLFPDIPKGHPVFGNIFMNIAANMLGLDNAATPLGLKAMEGLQEINVKKNPQNATVASNPMIMFLVLNTSGLTIIPVSIMVYRAQLGAANPCSQPNGHLRAYPHCHVLQHPLWHHNHEPVSENQSVSACAACHTRWYVRLGGCHHLGLQQTRQGNDGHGEHTHRQYYPLRHHHRIHHRRYAEESERV